MAVQQPESLFDAMPCPECGSQHLVQESTQSEDVFVDEDGNPEYYNPRSEAYDVLALYCTECDEQIWSADG